MLIDVTEVLVKADYVLELRFENGEQRRFDMKTYMDEKPWVRIKDPALFAQAMCQFGTVAWPGEIDIDPETLYEKSVSMEPQHGKAA